MEPLVCNPKNKCHRIKNASSKMEKLPTLSAVIFKHFSGICENYKCG